VDASIGDGAAAVRRRRSAVVVAGVTALTGLLAGCGEDPEPRRQALPASSTVIEPSPASTAATSTSVTREFEVIDLDDGRVLLHLPDDLTPSSDRTITGVFGETIRTSEFRGTGAIAVRISITRGPGVVDALRRASHVPRDGPAFEGRAYFDGRNELADLIDTRILGWQIGSDAVIWITATALTIDEIADIARHVEVVSA
jgi:hypothetical protein